MKKTIAILSLFLILACSSDDDDFSNPEFVEAVTGRYQLIELYTDTAIDFDGDGIEVNDLLTLDYCNISSLFDSNTARIVHKTYTNVSFQIPYSDSDLGNNLYQSICIQSQNIFSDLFIDETNEEVSLVQSDFWDDYSANFNARVTDLHVENEILEITLENKFYTPNDEWVETDLYMIFEKFD